MADSKITALASISTATDPAVDPLVIVDVSDTSMAASGTSKKVTLNNLLSSSPTATGAFSVTGLVTAGSATITGAATVGTTLGVTGVSTFAAGTALLPALTTTGDVNTGIYYPAADTFAVTTGGTERYRVDSSGNLLIGTTGTTGDITNDKRTTGGIFTTINNLTIFVSSGAATTIFAAPAESTLIVTTSLNGSNDPVNYNAVAIVKVAGGVATVTTISSAALMTITLSGLNVQATQTSGGAGRIVFTVLRIA